MTSWTASSAGRSTNRLLVVLASLGVLAYGAVTRAAHAGRRVPGPHRADGHGRHRGARPRAGGGRDARHVPDRDRGQRRDRRAPRALGVGRSASRSCGSSSTGAPTSTSRARSSTRSCSSSPAQLPPDIGRADARADLVGHGRDPVRRARAATRHDADGGARRRRLDRAPPPARAAGRRAGRPDRRRGAAVPGRASIPIGCARFDVTLDAGRRGARDVEPERDRRLLRARRAGVADPRRRPRSPSTDDIERGRRRGARRRRRSPSARSRDVEIGAGDQARRGLGRRASRPWCSAIQKQPGANTLELTARDRSRARRDRADAARRAW